MLKRLHAFAQVLDLAIELPAGLLVEGVAGLGDTPVTRKEWVKQALGVGRRRWLAGEIDLRESVARPKIENAMAALHDHGALRPEGEKVRAVPDGRVVLDALDTLMVESLRAE